MRGEEIKLSDKKIISLNVLYKVAQVLSDENLEFFAYFGSLIGAVRHNGMIPWDDDIDLAMPREDYEKLLGINWDSLGLCLSYPGEDSGYSLCFSKISDKNTFVVCNKNGNIFGSAGVGIDIFPIDGISKSCFLYYGERILIKYLLKFKNIRRSRIIFTLERGIFRAISELLIILLSRIVSLNTLVRLVDCIATLHRDSELVSCRVSPYFGKEVFPVSNLYPLVSNRFESFTIPVPNNYHAILCQVYGDYMRPPPVEQQLAPHNESFFYRDFS